MPPGEERGEEQQARETAPSPRRTGRAGKLGAAIVLASFLPALAPSLQWLETNSSVSREPACRIR